MNIILVSNLVSGHSNISLKQSLVKLSKTNCRSVIVDENLLLSKELCSSFGNNGQQGEI